MWDRLCIQYVVYLKNNDRRKKILLSNIIYKKSNMIYIYFVKIQKDIRLKVKVNPIFDAAFYKILNTIGDTCERTCCHRVLFYKANKFL